MIKPIFWRILSCFLLVFIGGSPFVNEPLASASRKRVIRIAIIENNQSHKFASEKYDQDYYAGIRAAADRAKQMGYVIEYKSFPFGRDGLDILKVVPDVKAWSPDAIIGPRSSNKFLLLKGQFTDTLVLSPLATASAVSLMPPNFYSLTLPNSYSVQAMVNFIEKRFPGRGVFRVVEADCKTCVDLSFLFSKAFQNRTTESSFLQDQVETIDINTIMKGYQRGDVILLLDTSYSVGVLMKRISLFLNNQNVNFVGGDDWGSWKAGYEGKIRSDVSYHGYRIIPWSLDVKSKDVSDLRHLFQAKYGRPVPDEVTFVSYRTLTSIVSALKKFAPSEPIAPKLVLQAYQMALKQDLNWFRPIIYSVYESTEKGEHFLEPVSAMKGKK